MIRAAALAAVFAISCCVAAGEARTPEEYGRLVADAAQRLEKAAQAGDESGALASRALKALPKRIEVQPEPGAAPVKVNNDDLLRALREHVKEGPDGIRSAARVLRNLQHNVSAQADSLPAGARQTLAKVLQRREFRVSRLEALQQRMERLLAAVIEAIGRAMGWVFDRLPVSPEIPRSVWRAIGIVMLTIAGAVALYLVVRLVMRLMPRGPQAQPATAPQITPVRCHSAWLAEAEAALQAQDYPAAVRALHMAALMRLDEAGLVSYADSRTDGRFVWALREGGRGDLAEVLDALNRMFGVVWYGMASAGDQEYAAAREHWRQLEALTAA